MWKSLLLQVSLHSFQKMTDILKFRRRCWISWQMKKLLFCVGPTGFWQRIHLMCNCGSGQKMHPDYQSQELHDCLEMWQRRHYFLKPTGTLWQALQVEYSFSPLLGVRDRHWKNWVKRQSQESRMVDLLILLFSMKNEQDRHCWGFKEPNDSVLF